MPEQRDVRMACFRAYQKFATEADWHFYRRGCRVYLQEPYETGTITYDHTGGTNEREVTLASGTWPTWAKFGKLLIGDVVSTVATRVSSSVITLDPVLNPGADVAAGTSYTLIRTAYPMPGDFRGSWEPTDENMRTAQYVGPKDWLTIERLFPTQTDTWFWTVMPSQDSYSQWNLNVHGYPTTGQTLDFTYQGRPRPIRLTGYETNSRAGTIAMSDGGTTVTGTSTAFTEDMVGSVLRIGDATNYPTGQGDLYPWVEQKIITAYSSATSITVDSAANAAYSGVKYTISDPLDVDEDLYELLVASAELQLATIRRSERLGVCIGIYKSARTRVMENNSKLKCTQNITAPIFVPYHAALTQSDRNEISTD